MRSALLFLHQAEGGFEEEGLDAESRSLLSPGGGGVRGGPGDEGGFEDLGSLEHATSESVANTKDQESLAFFRVNKITTTINERAGSSLSCLVPSSHERIKQASNEVSRIALGGSEFFAKRSPRISRSCWMSRGGKW